MMSIILQAKSLQSNMCPDKSTKLYDFTVFTCTYNRANTLQRTFDSLMAQTHDNFEWVVFDNGSTDNTDELIEELKTKATFPVTHLSWPDNTGFQKTFNQGINAAKGRFWIMLDSDDTCVPEALTKLKAIWDAIPADQQNKFAGVTVNCVDQHGELVGDLFPSDIVDSTYVEMMYRYRVKGEKWGFNRTDVLKINPFPEVENHINPGMVWRAIGDNYKTRYCNETLRTYYINEAGREDQLTFHLSVSDHSAVSRRLNSLTAINKDIKWFKFAPHIMFKKAVVYCWFSLYLNKSIGQILQATNSRLGKALVLAAFPAGLIMHVTTRKKQA